MTTPEPTNAELAEWVQRLEHQLGRVIDVVAERLSADSRRPGRPTRGRRAAAAPPRAGVVGSSTPDGEADDGEDEADEPSLEDWVDQLSERYYLRFTLQGWQDNTAIRAELHALWLAHQEAFGPDAGAFEQVYWHDALDRVLHRISNEVSHPRQRVDEEADLGLIRRERPAPADNDDDGQEAAS